LAKIVPGFEAPKQSVSVQVLIGQEGANHAEKKLADNLLWLSERGELPREVEDHFRRKYAGPTDSLDAMDADFEPVPDSSPNGPEQ